MVYLDPARHPLCDIEPEDSRRAALIGHSCYGVSPAFRMRRDGYRLK